MKRILTVACFLALILPAGCGEDVSKPEVKSVEVYLSPDTASVETNQSVWFRATVLNASDTTVTWCVDGKVCGDSLSGTISSAGRFTAPAEIPGRAFVPFTVEVRAVSNADPSRFATAAVTISESSISIQISPAEVELRPAGTQLFVAHVENASDSSVVWSIDPVPGGTDLGILYSTGHYQAPEPILDSTTVLVRATSVEDSTRSGAALVHLVPFPIVVTLSPDTARVGAGQLLELEFSIENTSQTLLDWYVNGILDGSTSVGSINQPGQYWAPSSVPPSPWIEIRAVSQQDPTRFAACEVEIVSAVKIECEDMTQFLDRGGVRTIYEVFKSNASNQHAIEGLDKDLEWIEIPVQLQHSGAYKVAFQNAANSATDVKISVLEPAHKRQGPEWILTVSGGGCG